MKLEIYGSPAAPQEAPTRLELKPSGGRPGAINLVIVDENGGTERFILEISERGVMLNSSFPNDIGFPARGGYIECRKE